MYILYILAHSDIFISNNSKSTNVMLASSCCHLGHNTCSGPFSFSDTHRHPTETLYVTLWLTDFLWWRCLAEEVGWHQKGYQWAYILSPNPSLPSAWEAESLARGMCYGTFPILRKVKGELNFCHGTPDFLSSESLPYCFWCWALNSCCLSVCPGC